MSQEKVEVIRRVFEAAARRDRSVLALYHPEVEWDGRGRTSTTDTAN